ncbi:MAG: release factor glutamine methyltransferase HemK [Rhodobacteraceae bacterium HLUCCA08]|nr:MAG: release factor glutamine methyltransferase HemK [Rhodobacteraceae bacterium HLUCCA08]
MSGIDAADPGQALARILGLADDLDIRDRKRLLAAAAGVEPGRLALLGVADFTDAVVARFLAQADRRRRGEPVSHILGWRDFWKHRFEVTPEVLDPRPETEILVAAALERPWRRVLDLGTGSGAILVSLLAERPETRGVGIDISSAALLVAGRNAAAIGVAGRLVLTPSDWYADMGSRYDLIVSNPPYIAASEMPGLAPELAHEPRGALTDEGDGLSAYRVICAGAPGHLEPGGWLMVEIGPRQGAAVAGLMRAAGLENVSVRADLDGRDRVVMGEMPRQP